VRRRAFIGLAALAATAIATPIVRATGARIVIVGGGFGGSACALLLKQADASLDVTLVDPDARYVTCPMSNEVVVGARKIDSLTLTREGLRRAGVRFVRAPAMALDADARQVRLDDGAKLAYERCVVAPGIRFLWSTPEGYDEAASERMPHAWKAGAQTKTLAAQLHAMDDGGVVAISLPTGLMRCPPGPYERASLVAEYLRRHKPRSKVLIFDANNHFPRQSLFTEAWNAAYRGLIEWIPSTEGGTVVAVDARNGTLRTGRGTERVAVVHRAQQPCEPRRLRAGLPCVRHRVRRGLVVAFRRVPEKADAGRDDAAVVREPRAVVEANRTRIGVERVRARAHEAHARASQALAP